MSERFLSLEPRRHVDISLHTDRFSEAEQKAKIVWKQHLAGWEAWLVGNSSDAEARFNVVDFKYVLLPKPLLGSL